MINTKNLAIAAIILIISLSLLFYGIREEKSYESKFQYAVKTRSHTWLASEIIGVDEHGCSFISDDGKEILIKGDYIIIKRK